MTEANVIALIAAIVAEVVAGVLVAIEAAVSRMSRVRAEHLVAEGRPGATRLLPVARDPARFVNALLLVRMALTVLAVALVMMILVQSGKSPGTALLITTVVMLIANFILLGVAPRTLGQQHADALALRSAGLVRALAALVSPLTRLLILLGNAVTPGKGYRQGPFATQAELREMLDRARENLVIEPDEQRMLHSVFELGSTLVRELMVPRTEMVWIERSKLLRQGLSLSLRSGFSRIPVVGDDLDDIVGVLHIKDVVSRIHEDDQAADSVQVAEVMRPAMLVPDSKPADDLLREFQASRTHLALLVDEYGGTAGLVTVEDILEEIVGEITDEYDLAEIPDCRQLGPGDYRISARMSIDDFAELTGLTVTSESEGVDTVAGLLARRLGVVPIPGSETTVGNFRLTAEDAEGRRNKVATIRVIRAVDNLPEPSRTASNNRDGK